MRDVPYECGEAASAGGDLELPVQIPDGSGGEETLHQQQHAQHKESSRQAVDDVLQDVDAVEGAHTRTRTRAACLGHARLHLGMSFACKRRGNI